VSDLVLRYDPTDHCLRSTGEPPGIVVFAAPGGVPTLAIDYAFEPSTKPAGVTPIRFDEDGISPTSTAVSVEAAVEACVGDDELRHLFGIACQAVRDGAGVLLAAQDFAQLRAFVDLAEEYAEAIERRLDA
jgi:hypothetical protein